MNADRKKDDRCIQKRSAEITAQKEGEEGGMAKRDEAKPPAVLSEQDRDGQSERQL